MSSFLVDRRKKIIKVTKKLLLTEDYKAITMKEIGASLNINRALLYRVYNNEYEIFIDIMDEQLDTIYEDLKQNGVDGEKFLVQLIDKFDKDKYLSILIPIAAIIIEENMTSEYANEYRKKNNKRIDKFAKLLEQKLTIESKNSKFLAINLFVLIRGTYPLTHLNGKQKIIADSINLTNKHNFKRIITINIVTLYRSLLKNNPKAIL